MDKEELKQKCLKAIEEHQEEIIALGMEAYRRRSWDIRSSEQENLWRMPSGSLDWSRKPAYPTRAAACPQVPREMVPEWL